MRRLRRAATAAGAFLAVQIAFASFTGGVLAQPARHANRPPAAPRGANAGTVIGPGGLVLAPALVIAPAHGGHQRFRTEAPTSLD
jgi:hypothetical protein